MVANTVLHPLGGSAWEIRDASGAPQGTLRMRGWDWHGELASPMGQWTFHMVGILRWRLVARDVHGAEVARMDLDWRGRGTLALVDGRRYWWTPEDWLGTKYTLTNEQGRPIARLVASGVLRWRAELEIIEGSLEALALPLCFAWYTIVVSWSSAVVATA